MHVLGHVLIKGQSTQMRIQLISLISKTFKNNLKKINTIKCSLYLNFLYQIDRFYRVNKQKENK